MTVTRTIYAQLNVNDEEAVRKDLGTIDYALNALEQVNNSVVSDSMQLLDGDSDSSWERYLKYLHDWAFTHGDEEFKGMSPATYDEWQDNEDAEEADY